MSVALLVAVMVAGSSEALAASVHGAVLIDNAVKVDEDRYKSPKDWERTLRFFRKVYRKKPGIVWMDVATTPKVKATHLANTNPGSSWEGINIYQVRGGVFIYVIAREKENGESGAAARREKS